MATPGVTTHSQPNASVEAQSPVNFLSSTPLGFITDTPAISALMGCLTPIGIVGGLYFGIGGYVAARLTDRLCETVGCSPDSTAGKVARLALPLISYVGTGCAALALAGIAWTPGIIAGLVAGTFLFHQLVIARGDAKVIP